MYKGAYDNGQEWTENMSGKMFEAMSRALHHYQKKSFSKHYTTSVVRKAGNNTFSKLNYDKDLIAGLR